MGWLCMFSQMLRSKLLVVLSLWIALCSSAQAKTVKELLDLCSSSEASEVSYCYGLVKGVEDMMGLLSYNEHIRKSDPRMVACSTKDIKVEAALQAFKNWSTDNPSLWPYSSSYGVMLAISQNWPCK